MKWLFTHRHGRRFLLLASRSRFSSLGLQLDLLGILLSDTCEQVRRTLYFVKAITIHQRKAGTLTLRFELPQLLLLFLPVLQLLFHCPEHIQ